MVSSTEPIGLRDAFDMFLPGQLFTYWPPGPKRQSGIFWSLLNLSFLSIFHILVFLFFFFYPKSYRQRRIIYPNKNRTKIKNIENRFWRSENTILYRTKTKKCYLRFKRAEKLAEFRFRD
ncbi:MAG: hypothetical protein A2Y10_02945 [Planctomycetes bacterium GWF2_41_51]|nr:MAG: hypothetical protein A2Y10_02945 [Planctomycetes bacterium GWF2_41_51]HBG27508.1 hypothetical protein [Phycisphaerales bacterium]